MHKTTMLEILDAAHLSRHVAGPFPERGGIMIVAPPGSLKTTLIKSVCGNHPDALTLGDINVQTLTALKSDLVSGRYSTLAFTEYPKLYERRYESASNLEGIIRQLVDEGFARASFQDGRMSSGMARAMIVGAMPEQFYHEHYQAWYDNGFLRRFLWCVTTISNHEALMDSIQRWLRMSLGRYLSKSPGNRSIPFSVDEQESTRLRLLLKDQPGTTTPFILLQKILAVLKWKYMDRPWIPMKIIEDFAPSLARESTAEIVLTEGDDEPEFYTRPPTFRLSENHRNRTRSHVTAHSKRRPKGR